MHSQMLSGEATISSKVKYATPAWLKSVQISVTAVIVESVAQLYLKSMFETSSLFVRLYADSADRYQRAAPLFFKRAGFNTNIAGLAGAGTSFAGRG